MSLQDIKDRVPTRVLDNGAIRYGVYDENGNLIRYEYMKREDEPVEEGTSINRTLFRNLQGDIYTGDRYSEPNSFNYELIEPGGTDDIFLKTWGTLKAYTEYVADDGTILKASGVRSETSTYAPVKAVDNDATTYWQSDSNTISWLQIELPKPREVTKVNTYIASSNASYFTQAIIQGSMNGLEWIDLATITENQTEATEIQLSNTGAYKFYRIYIELSTASYARVYLFQVLEYADIYKDVIDVDLPLTSYEKGKIVNLVGGRYIHTAGETVVTEDIIPKTWTFVSENVFESPEGIILSSSSNTTTSDELKKYAILACDGDNNTAWTTELATSLNPWIKLQFPYHIKITKMRVRASYVTTAYTNVKIQGSNDNINWHDLYVTSTILSSLQEITLDNPDYYIYYRFYYTFPNTAGRATLYELQVAECIQPSIIEHRESLENPYLNINNLGKKQINGTIHYGEKNSLVYNGQSWDILKNFVAGSYVETSNASGTRYVDIGINYKYIIITSPNEVKGDYNNNPLILIRDIAPEGYLYYYVGSSGTRSQLVQIDGDKLRLTSQTWATNFSFSYIAFC